MDFFYFGRKRLMAAAVITLMCCALMVVFPTTALYSARKGISLWATDVLPALLPFFICANFLQNIGVMKCLKSGIFPFVMSVLSGYPMGAKIIGDLRRQNEISLDEGKRLMSFCNTSGPAFIVGAVGAGMLGSGLLGAVIACAHYIGAFLNGVVYSSILKYDNNNISIPPVLKEKSMQESFTEAILMSLKSLGIILAYIVLFMFLTDLLHMGGVLSITQSSEVKALIKGIIEMTVGCGAAAECEGTADAVKCILCSFIISWGGLSVMGQTMSMLSGSGISFKYIFVSKLTHGLFSAAIAFLITLFML